MAPNLVTFIGFSSCVSSLILLIYYNPTLESTLPNWVFAWAGGVVFFYLTMDAIDGMQARKTKSSSPLGQLFDHGCDCMMTTVFGIMMTNVLGLGPVWKAVFVISLSQITFFLSQWEEKYTGVCRTSVGGLFGVTEVQLSIVIQLLACAWDPKISQTIVYEGWTLSECVFAFYLCFMGSASLTCIAGILIKYPSAVKELVFVFSQNSVVLVWARWIGIRPNEYVLVILLLGLCNSFATVRVIISTITHMDFPKFHAIAVPFFALVPARILLGGGDWVRIALAVYLGGALDHIIKTLIRVAEEISNYLGIYVFSITSKRD